MNDNGIPARPYLKPWYRIARDGERLVLEYAQTVVVLEGKAVQRLLPALLPLLDGSRSIDEITATLGHPIEPAVQKALRQMAESGLLTEGPGLDGETSVSLRETVNFLAGSSSGRAVSEIACALQQAKVGIAGAGGAEEIARLLQRSGISHLDRVPADNDEGALEHLDLLVVAPGSKDLARLGDWNRRALSSGVAWLQVLPFDGKYAAIGPLYLPGETCCYECFRLRRLSNVDYPEEFAALEQTPAPYPQPPSLGAAIAGLAATLALRWIANRDRAIPGAFYALEHVGTLKLTLHRVYRVPRCSACSGLEEVAAPLPWYKEVRVASR
jgi:bacteriocin biosynthesis cyclodehydratase domain-containing protein